MTLLLKVKLASLQNGTAVVPRMKSTTLDLNDVGATVFIWIGDHLGERSALHARAVLISYEQVQIPQTRDPSKRKDAFSIILGELSTEVLRPLSTDDLEAFRYSEGADGIESLGRIHRDRNDKIIRLTSGESAALAEHFQG